MAGASAGTVLAVTEREGEGAMIQAEVEPVSNLASTQASPWKWRGDIIVPVGVGTPLTIPDINVDQLYLNGMLCAEGDENNKGDYRIEEKDGVKFLVFEFGLKRDDVLTVFDLEAKMRHAFKIEGPRFPKVIQ